MVSGLMSCRVPGVNLEGWGCSLGVRGAGGFLALGVLPAAAWRKIFRIRPAMELLWAVLGLESCPGSGALEA